MKKIFQFCLIILIVSSSCKNDITKNISIEKPSKTNKNYHSFGDIITIENVLTEGEMLASFNSLQMSDTIQIKFASKISDVCAKKGCWIKLPVGKKEAMVRFKNYGFFVPKDAKNKEVIIEGKAFLKITPVKELQHYASDAGKSNLEIAKITKPEKSFAFEANGILLKK